MKNPLLNKTYLLFWKNLVLLKRQYIVTACEIILPTLFAIVLAYIRSKVQDNSYAYEYGSTGDIGFYEETEKDLLYSLQSSLFDTYYNRNQSTIIGYTPQIPIAYEILKGLVDDVNITFPPPPPSEYEPERKPVNITGFNSEADMEAFQSSLLMEKYNSEGWYASANFPFGVVFDGLSNTGSSKTISYKIRLNNGQFYDTRNLMQEDYINGPGYNYGLYRYSSFSGIQLLIDKHLFRRLTGIETKYNMSMQPFPYPEYKAFDIADLYNIFLPIFIITGFVFVVPTIVRGVVSEKETGIKELMKMAGLPEWMHWFGWMLNSLLVLIITVTVIVVILFIPFNSKAGAVFQHSDPTLLWVVMMVYAIWATTYCFAVSAFFEKPTLATTAGIVIWLVSFYGLGLSMEEGYGKNLSLGIKLLLCLCPNVGMHLTLKVICTFEASEKGAKWGNMVDTISMADPLTILYPFLMMLASILLNMIICLYFEAVLPKKFGVRKPFYFIFQPSEWGLCKRKKKISSTEQAKYKNDRPGFEEEPSGVEPGVEIRQLRKEFAKGKVAVNDISMNIFYGQIFCLLGENGAGKTTTMSMLTGLFSPTSGTALINGLDIRTDMIKIRENLGLCPQHNMLFDKMTVLEHLKFFGMLKGLSSSKAEAEALDLLKVLQIPEKLNELAMSLSGGQKRRLSLGCSIIGGSKVVFLDEPTSGMDPEARRAIWDILLRLRGDRIIVLTTHFMEEADVLGDRIAIMASGVLQCCGSPNYLKRFYGAGYTLSMTVREGAPREAILNTVRNYIADAYFKVSHSSSETELSIVLPSESNTSASFPGLFAELNQHQEKLGIAELGVGWTTMDEVFVRVEELSHRDNENGNAASQTTNEGKLEKARGLSLIWSQFYGLLMKKILWTIRRKRLIVSQMVIPVLLTIAAVAISRAFNSTADRTPALKLSLSPYKNPVTLYSSKNKEIGDIYSNIVGSSAKAIDSRFSNNVSDALLDVGRDDISYFRERHIIAAEIIDTNMKAMFSTIATHSAPVSMNILTNTWFKEAGRDYNIEVTNHPFRDNLYDLLEPAREDPEFATIISFIFGVLVPIGMALLVGSFIIAPTDERLCKGKQLQIMTGVNPVLYWGSMYICDYLLMLITICLMVACLPIFENHKTFTNHNGAGILFLIMAVYGIATLSFSYIFSTFARTIAGGFTLITIVHLLTGIGLGVGSNILESLVPDNGARNFVTIVGRLFPTFGVTRAVIQFARISSSNSRCNALTEEAKKFLCTPTFDPSRYGVSQDCCDNCAVLGSKACFEPAPYFQWTRRVWVDKYDSENFQYYQIPYDIPSLTQDLVYLGVIAVVYLVILILIEYDIFKLIMEKISKRKATEFQRTVNDADVIEESSRVSKLVAEKRTSDDAMIVDNLCKSFGVFSAVSSLSFGVHHGECFGLLGVNGAGKTTTFRMLTGDENRSNGNSYMDNLSLVWGRKQFLSKLGYCPQFDGIVGVLTGREMLSLFARLRGIPGNCVQKETDKWLQKTGLLQSGDVKCQKYSGGMKRRLSAAMALIGDPPVVLLDEPTSGVDPVARRQFWKIIASIRNSGQAIILTSHSMEECEELCSRLGIMVNGEMQCLGGVQHLKNKFAQGYSLTIKLKQEHYQNTEMTNVISKDVLESFNPCVLKDHHQTTMKFQIHSQRRRWEDLYRTMEAIKEKNQVCIEEYAITETTLEEVFLSFARAQHTTERVTTGGNFITRLFL